MDNYSVVCNGVATDRLETRPSPHVLLRRIGFVLRQRVQA